MKVSDSSDAVHHAGSALAKRPRDYGAKHVKMHSRTERFLDAIWIEALSRGHGGEGGRGGGVRVGSSLLRAVMSRICHSHFRFHICPHDRTTLASIFRCQRVCYLQHPPTTLAFPSKNASIRGSCACVMHTRVCVYTKPPGCGGGGGWFLCIFSLIFSYFCYRTLEPEWQRMAFISIPPWWLLKAK